MTRKTWKSWKSGWESEPLQPEQTYLVAATDMEFADFINYLPLPMREFEFEVPTIMPEVLEAVYCPAFTGE